MLLISLLSMSRKRPSSEPRKPCFQCYNPDHASEECTSHGPISCSRCFRLNVLTESCNCQDRCEPPPSQVLRLAGKKIAPRWYVDLNVNNREFAALINPTIERGQVSLGFAKWLRSVSKNNSNSSSDTVTFEITRKELILEITCDVSEHQTDEIHIGADLMMFLGYKFSMEDVSIDSNQSYIASSPYEVNYAYNLPGKAKDLRLYLQAKAIFLRQTRTIKDHYGTTSTSSPLRRVIRINRAPSRSSLSSESDN